MTNQPATIEERISARTDLTVAGATSVSSTVGGLAFKDMGQVLEFSKLMAVSKQAVPKHLRGEPGACMAITLQALNWRMDPFAVANKSYMVNDRIAYEAQLVHAVVEQRAPIKGRITGKIEGQGPTRKWRLSATTNDGATIDYEGPEISTITTKNSPLWKADPDQQLWYYSVRAMCRRHFPDVILGVYEKEEMENAPMIRDVTPKEPGGFAKLATQARQNASPEAENSADSAIDAISDPTPTETQTAAVAPDFSNVDTSNAFPGSDEFTQGAKAFTAGVKMSACPFDPASGEAVDWLGGWTMAQGAAQ